MSKYIVLDKFFKKIPIWHIAISMIAYALGILTSIYSNISFETSISINSLIQSGATFATGLIVALYVQRIIHTDKDEKDFLIKQLDSLCLYVTELEDFEGGRPLAEVNAMLKKINTTNIAINDVVMTLGREDMLLSKFDFQLMHKELRALITTSPIRDTQGDEDGSQCSAAINNGIVELSKDRQLDVEAKVQEFTGRILKAQVMIINA